MPEADVDMLLEDDGDGSAHAAGAGPSQLSPALPMPGASVLSEDELQASIEQLRQRLMQVRWHGVSAIG